MLSKICSLQVIFVVYFSIKKNTTKEFLKAQVQLNCFEKLELNAVEQNKDDELKGTTKIISRKETI